MSGQSGLPWIFAGDPYKMSDGDVISEIERLRLDVQVWCAGASLGLCGIDSWRTEAAKPIRYAVFASYVRGATRAGQ